LKQPQKQDWKTKLHDIIYEANTPAGKWFDIILLGFILLSVLLALLESVDSINNRFLRLFDILEWMITILFSIEYVLRIISVKKPLRYALSFFGIVDLLAILPKYLSLFLPGAYALSTLRVIRLLRVFRILKLMRYIGATQQISKALNESKAKIFTFLFFVLLLTIVLGSIMYLVEGGKNGFDSIPKSIYWSIVTITTVGYGDIAPVTTLGQFLASIIMFLGYGIIAVPTGLVTVELGKARMNATSNTEHCPVCMEDTHLKKSNYCHRCGAKLNE
jgi:voltage-gated potassium channel